jgi:hypothetical protein
MKASGRARLVSGILVVVVIVGLLTVYLTHIMSQSQSFKATLAANAVSLGTDYGGLIVKQNVQEGDKVSKGQVLFEIQSADLNAALTSKSITVASLPFSVDPTNNYIELTASDAGVIQKIFYQSGSYVPAGSIVANIDTVGSLYVSASFHLSPPDYARINKKSLLNLTLPDNTTANATVYSINLVPDNNLVDTVVKARLQNADISDFRFAVGTPVNATLKLSNANWYQALINDAENLFKPLGR